MRRRILIGCYEVPGYGGASTASYRLVELLRAQRFDAALVNLIDEQDAGFFEYVFGPAYGNPRGLSDIHNCVLAGPLYYPHPELADLIDAIAPDVMIGVGFIGALLLKRAAMNRPLAYLTTGCQQVKDAVMRGVVRDYLTVKGQMERGMRRPHITSPQEREAVEIANIIVTHSEMTRRLYAYYYPSNVGKVLPSVLSFARWIHGEAREYAGHALAFGDRDIDALFVASSWERAEKNYAFVKQIAALLPKARIHVAGEAGVHTAPNIDNHGLVAGRDELFALMGRAKTLVCPSVFDTAPGILFEASALGCNIVASENCGNWMICANELLVRPFTSSGFAERIALSLAGKREDHIAQFLDDQPWQDFLETLDVL